MSRGSIYMPGDRGIGRGFHLPGPNRIGGSPGVLGKAGTSGRQPSYYFSAAGSDANDGKTLATPKQTITAFNGLTLVASDYVVFRGGDTFAGAAVVGQSGSTLSSIIIGSYGVGQATIAPTAGSNAIATTDQSYITIQNLTCTGADTTAAAGAAGIWVAANANILTTNVIVNNCTVSGFGDSGISYNLLSATNARFFGCQILNCTTFGNTLGTNSFTCGIWVGGIVGGVNVGNSGTSYWPVDTFTIDSCIAHDNLGKAGTTNWSGSGIKIGSCKNSNITNCKAYNNGANCNLPSGGATGIWMSVCNNTFIKFCESYNNSSVNADGCGFDMDGGTQNSGCLFNYSHDNTGAGFMDFSFTGAAGDNVNNTIAFNISSNDCTTNHGAIVVSGSGNNLTGCKVYNNTVYCKSTIPGVGAIWVLKGAGTLSATIANNIFVSEQPNTRLVTTNATNPGAGVVFAGNNYYGISTIGFEWNGTTYASMAAWQTATGQEKIASVNVGQTIEPQTYLFGSTITGDASGARLTTGSGLLNTGVNLFTNFSIDPGSRDYFGGAVSSAGPYSVGCSWAGSALTTVYLTTPGAGTQTIPSDFVSLFSVEAIGAGGGNTPTGAGPGGGAYAKIRSTSTPLAANSNINYGVGAGTGSAAGGDTWWNSTSLANAVSLGSAVAVAAQGGQTNVTTTPGNGGLAASSVGTTTFNGGNGGTSSSAQSGGGGAGGPFGAGAKGGNGGTTGGWGGGGGGGSNGGSTPATPSSLTGGNGGNGWYGLGGATGGSTQVPGIAGTRGGGGAGAVGSGGSQPGGAGGNGIEWDSTHGPGGGGGASVGVASNANAGGLYGGGAGGRGGAPGGQGIIRFAYKTAGVV